MPTQRLVASGALGICLAFAVVAGPTTADAAIVPDGSSSPSIPQVSSSQDGATWLADQLTPAGYIPSSSNPGQPDLSATANAALALTSADVDPAGAEDALTYLAANVDAFVTVDGADGPGQLALLALDAEAVGQSPSSFGGTDLIARLLATQQTSGPDIGLFGTEQQLNDYYTGTYNQGLALAALSGAGLSGTAQVSAASTWLLGQQCPDGGWALPDAALNPCDGHPADFAGPDTNSTSLAVQGLSAVGVLGTTAAHKALGFLVHAEDADGGWGYEPNAAHAPGSTDPDSTALVIQGIEALAKSASASNFVKGTANPVSVLLGFQLTSGPGSGAFFYPGSSDPNTVATYEAVPALAGVVVPFDLAVTTSSLASGTLGASYAATLTADGGTTPYSWKVLSGSLPPGLKLHKSSGLISGKPTANGTSVFTVEVLAAKASTSPHTQAVAWRVLSITT
jgi:hypothetical protein